MLKRYADINGNVKVPKKFVIPQNNDWPCESWGKSLGRTVVDVKAGKIYKANRDELLQIGVVFYKKRTMNEEEIEYNQSTDTASIIENEVESNQSIDMMHRNV